MPPRRFFRFSTLPLIAATLRAQPSPAATTAVSTDDYIVETNRATFERHAPR